MRRLTPRERLLLTWIVPALALLLTWTIFLKPTLERRADALARITELEQLAAMLEQVPALHLSVPPADLPPLRQRVTETARASQLDIRRLDPQGSTLAVSLDVVPFAELVGWLDGLTAAQDVRVVSAEIGRRPEPGIVSARLVLEAQ